MGLSQILFFSLLSITDDELRVGDCLSMAQVQELVGVEDPSVWVIGDCRDEYQLAGDLTQNLNCGLVAGTGRWEREVIEHDMPGIYVFSDPDCMSSVTKGDYVRSFIADMTEADYCSTDYVMNIGYQRETVQTKRFQVFDGELYLPNPLQIHREEFSPADGGTRSLCRDYEFTAAHVGWGVIEAKWSRKNCDDEEPYSCKIARFTKSEDADGHACGKVTKIKNCN